ncbi:MAG: AMP-binding protein [Desulfuromonadaceae bacterium]
MKTIDVLLTETCLRQKEKTALREKVGNVWAETSYASLLQQARQVASGLQAHDFAAGGHAAILAPSSSRWVITYFGILLAGGIIVPVDKELKATELKHVLSDCAAQVIFTTHSYLDVLLEIKKDLPQLQRIILIDQRRQKSPQNRKVFATIGELVKEWHLIREEFHLPRERTAALEKLADEIYHLLLPEEGSTGKEKTGSDLFAPLNRLRQKLTQQIELLNFEDLQGAEPPRSPSRQTQAVAIILYTSGTTGRSKGAMLSHANIISNMRGACQLFQLNQDMHTLSFLPINHVFEQVCGILLPLSLGGTVSFAESLKKLVPAVFRVFYDRIMKTVQGQAFSRLLYRLPLTKPLVAAKIRKKLGENTTFISGGAALDPEIARGFRELGVKILQGYGITETSPVVSAEPPQAPKLGTVGPPLEDVQVRINHPNAEGVGEILIRGPNVMLGTPLLGRMKKLRN